MRAGFGGYLAQPVYNKFLSWCGYEDEAKARLAGMKGGLSTRMGAALVNIGRLAIGHQ